MAARPIRPSPAGSKARANELMEQGLRDVRRVPYEKALRSATTHRHDYLNTYVADLGNVIDMVAIRDSKVRLGVDPLGGAGVHYWAPIAEHYGLDLTVVSDVVDPTFSFMTRRLGRPHSHGSLIALCDAATHRAQGPFRYRIRLRHRPRPARRRGAQHRPAAPESLPRGVCSLSVSESSRNGTRKSRSAKPSSAAR